VHQGDVYEGAPLPYRWGESVELTATEEVAAPIASSSEVERRVTTEELPQEAEAGEELGEVEVFVDGQSIGRSALVAKEGYEEASLWDRVLYSVRGIAERALDVARQALE
jgi:D-alanyl-D-alanine carboxypeptidase (penicillin-binding protein 5/6)